MLKLLLSVFFVNWMWPLFALLLANVSVGQVFNIEASEPMSFEASQFKAYENAWSVTFNVANTNAVLVFAICKDQCPTISSGFHILTCTEILTVLEEQQWHNHYIAENTVNNTQMLCDKIRSDVRDVQTGAGNILNYNTGGALVHLRLPDTYAFQRQRTGGQLDVCCWGGAIYVFKINTD